MSGRLHTVAEAAARISAGAALLVAGDASLLARLPVGNWIGGSVPHLPGGDTGPGRPDLLHVTELPDCVQDVSLRTYDATSIRDVYADIAGKGFGVIVIPGSSPTHLEFALQAPRYRDFAVRPLVGWIAGGPPDDPEGGGPVVFSGATGEAVRDGAVVMQVTLPPGYAADVQVINIFEQGDGPRISFPADGFDAREALIDGVPADFAEYLRDNDLDTRLPLVADYYGVMVNVSFQAVDVPGRAVRFYSPVFAGLSYRHAKPIGNYAGQFLSHLPAGSVRDAVFSCNCILNYFYSEPEARQIQALTGPLTVGEVAYQLLNQTIVYLTISRLD